MCRSGFCEKASSRPCSWRIVVAVRSRSKMCHVRSQWPHCLCKLHDLAASVFVREFHSQEECSRAWRCNSWQTFSWASFVGFDAVRGQEGEKTRSVTRTFPVFDSRMSKSSSGMRSTYQLIDGRKLICSDGYVLYRSL
jgi:hypothetical protein